MATKTPWVAREALPAPPHAGQDMYVSAHQWSTSDRLASFVAHEVRNPLAALRATVELALATDDFHRRSDLLKKVIDSIDDLSEFLTELLVLVGPRGAEMAPVDLAPLVVGVMRLFAVQAEVLKVRMAFQAPSRLPKVWGNAPLLRHAVMNLIKNALEAMPQGGRLSVSIHSPAPHDTVCLAVKDTGSGIPQSRRERLFCDVNNERVGHGVGLPFVHRVVTAVHGGRVWFDSTESKGTTFYIELPAAA